jgi:hypothetical protein
MALTQYKNSDVILNNITTVNGNRFLKKDYELLDIIPSKSTFGLPTNSNITSETNVEYDNHDVVEIHAYTINGDYLNSNHSVKNWNLFYRQNDSLESKIRLDVHNDIRSMGFRQGEYKIVYNFIRNYIGSHNSAKKMFIWEISDSRQELILRLTHPSDSDLLLQFNSFVNNNSMNTDYKKNYVLNFSENKIVTVINTLKLSDTELLIKLYEPLPEDISENFQCWLGTEVISPVIDNIVLYPSVDVNVKNTLAGPNFDVDIDYWTVTETDLKNWNELLGDNAITSQKLVDQYFSGSLSGIDLNIRYNEFDNFIHFSSAEERVNNFIYKLNLIEQYESELALLDTVTGSIEGNTVNTVNRKNSVISNFDDFEKYLYFQATGSIYTYPGSSSVDPFPKVPTVISNVSNFTWEDAYQSWYEANILFAGQETTVIPAEYPYSNYSVTSSAAQSWITSTLQIAQTYDRQNRNALIKTIPEHIRRDEANSNYELFVNMIAQHFDIIWTYIDKLTSLNNRNEHPDDGLSDELLYDVAKGYGWTLTNGNQVDDLWKYVLGTNEEGVLENSGSTGLRTKPSNKRTTEVWRRIVNNLPYILKTKGTSRGVKALLSAYGVPRSELVIREYGGTTQFDETPNYDYAKHDYLTELTGTETATIPWKKVNTHSEYPSHITLIVNPNNGLLYSYNKTSLLNVGSAFGVSLETTSSHKQKGTLNFYLNGSSGYLTASIEGGYVLDGNPLLLSINRTQTNDTDSEDQTYTFSCLKTDGKNVITYLTASLDIDGSSQSTYNDSWTTDSTLYIGTSSVFGATFSGSFSELRYWKNALSQSVINSHCLSNRSYRGNSESSSYYDLQLRIPFSDNTINYSETQSLSSIHPNQNINVFTDSSPLTASLTNFTSESYTTVLNDYVVDTPSLGANSLYSDKIKIDNNSLSGRLSVDSKAEVSEYSKSPTDSNRLAIAFSPQNVINEDIFEQMGHFKIDDYIGDPQYINQSGYPKLKTIMNEYWKKYSDKNNYVDYIRLVSLYDFSLFKQLEQVLPMRANKILGLLIEPTVLERNKVKSQPNISILNNLQLEFYLEQPTMLDLTGSFDSVKSDIIKWKDDFGDILGEHNSYSGSIFSITQTIDGEYNSYSGSINSEEWLLGGNYIGNTSGSYCGLFINSNYENPSEYRHLSIKKVSGSLLDSGYGYGYITQSNSQDVYNPVSNYIYIRSSNNYYNSTEYFYSSSVSASLDNAYSSSLKTSDAPNPNDLALGIKKYRYLGTKISGPAINENSSETIDGGPVVTSFDTPGNELYTKDYDVSGSLTVN